MDEVTADAWPAEPHSKVAFDIEDTGHGVVKLTVVHAGFAPGSNFLQGISAGWPAVLASLKTLLETGTALPGSWAVQRLLRVGKRHRLAVEGPQGLCPRMRAGQRGYVGHPPVAVTDHHDVIVEGGRHAPQADSAVTSR